MPFAAVVWGALNTYMLEVVERSDSWDLWNNALRLPEIEKAILSVQKAWLKVQKVPWPGGSSLNGALEATLSAMKLDTLHLKAFGAAPLDDAALYLVRHFGVSLNMFRGLVAAKAAQNDTRFFRRLADAIKYEENNRRARKGRRLRDEMTRHWLPLGLWLMDDRNAVSFLGAYLQEPEWERAGETQTETFGKARIHLGLFQHPKKPIQHGQRVGGDAWEMKTVAGFGWLLRKQKRKKR